MISVVVPCLNEEKNLPFFLGSLAAQSWRYLELVIVDGGSSDRSRKVVSDWEKHTGIYCTKLINETRNLGFVRNWGARAARGDILVFTNSDAVLPRDFFSDVLQSFLDNYPLMALSGRTVPLGGGALGSVAYAAFDWLRWVFSKIGRFSPSGNFLAVRTADFWRVGGFPEIRVNEDGVLGSRISRSARERGVKIKFDRNLLTYHFSAKRWKGKGLKTLLFYSYVFGNFSPFLKRILSPILRKSSREFNVND